MPSSEFGRITRIVSFGCPFPNDCLFIKRSLCKNREYVYRYSRKTSGNFPSQYFNLFFIMLLTPIPYRTLLITLHTFWGNIFLSKLVCLFNTWSFLFLQTEVVFLSYLVAPNGQIITVRITRAKVIYTWALYLFLRWFIAHGIALGHIPIITARARLLFETGTLNAEVKLCLTTFTQRL